MFHHYSEGFSSMAVKLKRTNWNTVELDVFNYWFDKTETFQASQFLSKAGLKYNMKLNINTKLSVKQHNSEIDTTQN